MGDVKAFIDTNIIIYLYSDSDRQKRECAFDVLRKYDCQISTQVLNEFSNVCTKKWKYDTEKIQLLIELISSYCDIAYIYEDTIADALEIYKKYGYSYYDSLIIASALSRDCKYLLSEDMADSQIIEGKMVVKNIFLK